MELEYKLVKNSSYKNYTKIKHLFEHAFPSVERPPFNILMSFNHNDLYGVEDNGTFVGLVDLVIYEDLLYVFFLAIKKTYRGKGIGTKILSDIKEKYQYKYRIYLMAEDPNIECDNHKEREKRIGFYKRNGFKTREEKVIEFGVQYIILYQNKVATKQDFLDHMKYLLGEENYNKYYVMNVK